MKEKSGLEIQVWQLIACTVIKTVRTDAMRSPSKVCKARQRGVNQADNQHFQDSIWEQELSN